MGFLQLFSNRLRKLILLGWAFAVVWIYLGNLVNFHQNHIWGKQLIPTACYSTRAKEKNVSPDFEKYNSLKHSLPGLHFDFSTPDQQVFEISFIDITSDFIFYKDFPVAQQGFETLSFRGPPSA